MKKQSELNKILGYKNFYEKHIYPNINNKRLDGRNKFIYELAGNLIINKIDKFIRISRAEEPDFTLMKQLGDFIAIHKATSNRFWTMKSDYQLELIKKYLPGCIYNGMAYRFLGLNYKSSDFNGLDKTNIDDIKLVTHNKIQVKGIACCSTSKSFVDSIDVNSEYINNNDNVVVRFTMNISNGIDVEQFWKELLKVAYTNDVEDFENDFKDSIGGSYEEEAEVIGEMNNSYEIYNWDEIYDEIQKIV